MLGTQKKAPAMEAAFCVETLKASGGQRPLGIPRGFAGAFSVNGFPEKKTPPQVGLVAGF